MRRIRKLASGSVARPSSSESDRARSAAEPGPERCAILSSAESTSARVSSGARLRGPLAAARTAEGPTPIRPCRGPADRKATAAAISSGSSRRRSEASRLTFSDRAEVSAIFREVASSSAKSTGARGRLPGPEPLEQPLDELRLGGVDLAAGHLDREELAAIHLGHLPGAPGARRPLHREGVAAENRSGGPVPLEGPGVHRLPSGLAHRAQRDQRARARAALDRLAGLLLELAPRPLERILPGPDLTLGDAPRALVLAVEERAARVHQEHLDPGARAAEHHQTRASL